MKVQKKSTMESKSGMEAVAQETIIGNSLGKVYFTAFFKSLFLT